VFYFYTNVWAHKFINKTHYFYSGKSESRRQRTFTQTTTATQQFYNVCDETGPRSARIRTNWQLQCQCSSRISRFKQYSQSIVTHIMCNWFLTTTLCGDLPLILEAKLIRKHYTYRSFKLTYMSLPLICLTERIIKMHRNVHNYDKRRDFKC
jgi:hypothetical protein